MVRPIFAIRNVSFGVCGRWSLCSNAPGTLLQPLPSIHSTTHAQEIYLPLLAIVDIKLFPQYCLIQGPIVGSAVLFEHRHPHFIFLFALLSSQSKPFSLFGHDVRLLAGPNLKIPSTKLGPSRVTHHNPAIMTMHGFQQEAASLVSSGTALTCERPNSLTCARPSTHLCTHARTNLKFRSVRVRVSGSWAPLRSLACICVTHLRTHTHART